MTETEESPIWVQLPPFDKPVKWITSYYDYDVFGGLLLAIADWCVTQIKSDNQCLVIVSGGTGSGKSNVAMNLIREILKILKREWVLKEMYLYTLYDLAEKIESGTDNPINWFDEGSIAFNSLDSTTEAGKLVGMFFDTVRIDHYITIVCMPNNREMNGRVIKHADLFIDCPDKVPLPDFSPKGFFEVSTRKTYKSGKHFDTRRGVGIFRPAPKKIREPYEALKRQKVDEFKRNLAKKLLKRKRKEEKDTL